MRDTFGKLDNHAAEIVNHRQQHAANVIHLLGRYRVGMSGFQLTDGGHVPYPVNQGHDRFTHAFLHDLFADDFAIGQREQQRRAQSIDIHTQGGEDLHHFDAPPQQQVRQRVSLRFFATIIPGFG